MGKYSEIPDVDEAFARWVRDEDPPAAPAYPDLKRAISELDPLLRVHPIVHPTVEHSAVAVAVKATRLVEEDRFLYIEFKAYLSRWGRLGFVEWEWRRGKEDREPSRAPEPPDGSLHRIDEAVRGVLEREGVKLVPPAEARREVRVADDPNYDGRYYEIQVFEVLFGMGYPERQR